MSGVQSLRVDRVVNGLFGSNTYLLTRPGCLGIIVIDPGDGVVGFIAKHGGDVEYVFLTHEHYDHISGLSALTDRWRCRVVCSRECSRAIADPTRNFSRYLIQQDVACKQADLCCEDIGWSLDWFGRQFRFIPTAGHSQGSICIAVDNLLFTGDSLLPDVKRVTKLPGGSKKELEKSLAMLMDAFDPGTQVYPGHGEPFRLKDAKLHMTAAAKTGDFSYGNMSSCISI